MKCILLLAACWLQFCAALPLRAQLVSKNFVCMPGTPAAEKPADVQKRAEAGDANAQFQYGFMLYMGCNDLDRDHATAAQWWRSAAAQGNLMATVDLGQLYLTGDGVPRDPQEAIRLFQKAGDAGEISGYYHLAGMYGVGNGVKKDYAEEAKWYRVLAEKGVVDAMFMLGNFYDEGHGVPEDDDQAMIWWKRAAEKGNKIAAAKFAEAEARKGGEDAARAAKDLQRQASKGNGQAAFSLAELYLSGEGVPRDPLQAKRWFEVAADQNYGRIEVANRLWAGRGLAKDAARAAYWYQKTGCELAGYQLGKMYELGDGVPRDYAKAADCYRQGMERATHARLGLAELTAKGLGVQRDEKKALDLHRESAERELGGVAFGMAMAYDLGRGVPHDELEAARWWRMSGVYHNGGAALNLAKKLAAGTDVPRDAVAAYVWTTLAADITYYAKSARGESASHLSSEQLKLADGIIEHCWENKKHFGAFYDDTEPVTKMSLEQLREAASQDDPHALFSLAYRLETGQGMSQDMAAAMRLYRQVVLEGGADLYVSLAAEYEKGIGRAKDAKLALDWYRGAAEAGSEQAQYHLAVAYESGQGVETNFAEACKWFLLAADKFPDASTKAESLKAKLSEKQFAEAHERAALLRSSFSR